VPKAGGSRKRRLPKMAEERFRGKPLP
jgi:hypothetical protein